MRKLEEFIKQANGQKYALNPTQLIYEGNDAHEDLATKKTFFCSELVASCYKILQVLP